MTYQSPTTALKPLPKHLKYAYLEDHQQFPVIIANNLSRDQEKKLLNVLRKHKKAINWTLVDFPGINPFIYSIGGGSPTNKVATEKSESNHPKRGKEGSHEATGSWDHLSHLGQPMGESSSSGAEEVRDDCRKESTRRDGYRQIHIALVDQHKTTFTCHFGAFAYTKMPFGLCNASSTLQRCMISIFSDLLEDCMEVFMDDFIVYTKSLEACLDNPSQVLHRCIDSNLVLNFEKCHFMVTEGIVLGHLISAIGIEVDKVKVDIISSLSNPTSVWKVRSFLGHVGFYRWFIKDFSKIALPLPKLLQKDMEIVFDQPCVDTFQELKKRLASMPIPQAPNYEYPFELMCDASNFALGAVLGQRVGKQPFVIAYASQTMDLT
ncbi:Retrovirus-related Pol polyprotein, partial [Mucuna pruriens]